MTTAFTSSRPLKLVIQQRRSSHITYASSDPLIKPAQNVAASPAAPSRNVTIEYQRSQAKAMQQYFRSLQAEGKTEDAQVFGWTKKNEINNGRWVMMGLAIGLLTEYATAVNFPDQLKLMVSYLGIADIYD